MIRHYTCKFILFLASCVSGWNLTVWPFKRTFLSSPFLLCFNCFSMFFKMQFRNSCVMKNAGVYGAASKGITDGNRTFPNWWPAQSRRCFIPRTAKHSNNCSSVHPHFQRDGSSHKQSIKKFTDFQGVLGDTVDSQYWTGTLDNSNLPLTWSEFLFPSGHFLIILPSITGTSFVKV